MPADILGNLVLLGTNEDAHLYGYDGSSFQEGFPGSNLGIPGFSTSWRAAIGATPVLDFDRGPGAPDAAGLICAGANLRPGIDTVRLRVSTVSDFSTTQYDSGAAVAVNTNALGSRPHYPRAGVSFGWVFPAALDGQYWRIDFDITGHPDGYVEMCAVTGSGYWPVIDRAADASFDRQGEEEQPILSGPARSGFAVLEQRFPFRAMLPAALRDLQGITSNLLEHDGRIGWVVAPFLDRSTHSPRLGYGRVKEPILTVNPAGAGAIYRSTTLALVEATE